MAVSECCCDSLFLYLLSQGVPRRYRRRFITQTAFLQSTSQTAYERADGSMYCFSVCTLVLGILFLGYLAVILSYAGIATSAAWVWAAGGLCLLFISRCAAHEAKAGTVSHKGIWIAGGLILLAGICTFAFLAGKVAGGMTTKPDENADVILVLGAQVKKDRPSRALRKRLDTALAYGQEHPEAVFVLSGGQGSGEDISEAECMARCLQEQGIAQERLFLEDTSTTTLENLKNSDRLYQLKDKNVVLVSNNFHIARALLLADKAGYTHVSGLPAPIELVMLPHYFVRETIALAYYMVRS